MDLTKLTEAVEKAHRVRLDPHDPVFMVATVAEEVGKDTLAAVTKAVTAMADQIATASVLAENAAKARAGNIVTDAAQWGAEQIRQASADAAARVLAELKPGLDALQAKADEAKAWSRISMWGAAASGLAAMAVIGWQVWGPA